MERRQSTRIPFKATAFVSQCGKQFPSETKDISRDGLFIKTRRHYIEGEKTRITICLQNGPTTLSVTLPCAVARVSDSGIGCTSSRLDPETLLFMSNLIHTQKIAPQEFMQIFYSYLDGLDYRATT